MNAEIIDYEKLLIEIKKWKLKRRITTRVGLGMTIGIILFGSSKPLMENHLNEIFKIIDILLDIDPTVIDQAEDIIIDNYDYAVIGHKGASWPTELSVIQPHYYIPIKVQDFLIKSPV